MLIAQAADGLGNSTGILGVILGSALLTAVIGAYKFAVSFRTTERGLSRQRIRDANKGERQAIQEGSLWQSRCADLEYVLRRNGIEPPVMGDALRKLVDDTPSELPPKIQWDDPASGKTGQ